MYAFNNIDKKIKRSHFLETLVLQLMKPNIEKRIKNIKLPIHIRRRSMKMLDFVENEPRTSKRPKGLG